LKKEFAQSAKQLSAIHDDGLDGGFANKSVMMSSTIKKDEETLLNDSSIFQNKGRTLKSK
jgi:hypothetical protein